MKRGVHKNTLAASLHSADEVFLFQPDDIGWSVQDIADQCQQSAFVGTEMDSFVAKIVERTQPGDQILVMSNGGFGGIHGKLLEQ
ncbi:UDP-N-acetylmuramate:L-alanyl-gamma-D-glutamyl-meso-diaminopimelate ligase, partial [Vibrio astriarenae]